MQSSYIEKVIDQLSRVSGGKETVYSFRQNHGPKGDLPVPDFIRELTIEGQKAGFTCVKNFLPLNDASAFLSQVSFPVLLFREAAPGQLTPVFVYPDDAGKVTGRDLSTEAAVDVDQLKAWLPTYVRETNHALREAEVQILFVSFVFIDSVAEQAV